MILLAAAAMAAPPTLTEIAAYEATFGVAVPWPAGAAPIGEYSRRYSRAVDGNLYAQFVRSGSFGSGKPGIVIVPADKALWMMDGGCSVLTVRLHGLHDPRNRIDCGGNA